MMALIGTKQLETKKDLVCDVCKDPLEIYNSQLVCISCGQCVEVMSEQDEAISNYNNDPNASSTLKIVGLGAKAHQKHHIQIASDYRKKRVSDSLSEFEALYNKSSKIERPPMDVYRKASELFNKIQEGRVNRSGKRLGIKVACISVETERAGMPKERNALAQMHGISVTLLNQGIDDLERLHADGKINIPTQTQNIMSFISQNFKKYNIDFKYAGFVSDFVKCAEQNHISPSSGINPKCVGTIFLLAKLLGRNDIIKKMAESCDISKPTYTRFYATVIEHHRIFRSVFKAHKTLDIKYDMIKKLISVGGKS
jgi:transcription initiation factor TFIIIB Brf1 subunit/transcription initiation factor TFIIB